MPQSLSLSPARILIVEDQERQRELWVSFFRDRSCHIVEVAGDADEAWQRVTQASEPYDIALIEDLIAAKSGEIPQLMGVELFKKIKSRSPSTEGIILATRGWERPSVAFHSRVFCYREYPSSETELALYVDQALEHQKLQSSARESKVLEQLMVTRTALLGKRNLQEVLDCIVRGVRDLGFDRARLFLKDGQTLIRKAEAGGIELLDEKPQLATDDPSFLLLCKTFRPYLLKRGENCLASSDGSPDQEGEAERIYAPLIWGGEVIGNLSVDNKYSRRPIAETDMNHLGSHLTR